ncbi:hypothetical protein [Pleomorphovibrio marinus]|uniref:hypothetical protein n=1 Tax=Pleomorphovibrio marinus TaxID=2164132 RepID=UPI000E0AF553|nr:hypothetical protein [Pleomorphovibrio marinus]
MKKSNKAVLLKDILSNGGKKRVVYGKKNEVVIIIRESRPALIVEGKSGRFPVNEKDLREF